MTIIRTKMLTIATTARVLSFDTASCSTVHDRPFENVGPLKISDDGTTVYSYTDGRSITRYSIMDSQTTLIKTEHDNIAGLFVSPDNSLLLYRVLNGHHTIMVDSVSGKRIEPDVTLTSFDSIRFHPQESVFIGYSLDCNCALINRIPSGRTIDHFVFHGPPRCVNFIPDSSDLITACDQVNGPGIGQLVVVSRERPTTKERVWETRIFGKCLDVRVSPDGSFVVVSVLYGQSQNVHVLSTIDGCLLFRTFAGRPSTIRISHDSGHMAFVSDSGWIVVHEAVTGRLIQDVRLDFTHETIVDVEFQVSEFVFK